MYTVVLMAAMSSGTAAPDWHRGGGFHGGCHGSCHGSVPLSSGCYGCLGTYGGYNTNAGPAYGGTCIGTYGGYAISGPNPIYGCWGCWGSNSNLTVYQGSGCYGYGSGVSSAPGFGVSFQCNGCYGCYGGWSCYGSPTNIGQIEPIGNPGGMYPVNPSAVPSVPLPKIEETTLPKKEARLIRSKVIIDVPENAKLYVDDNLMKTGAGAREFQTPPLSPGQTYYYEVKVEITREGKTSTQNQRLVIRPGETVTAAFSPGAPAPEVVTVRAEQRD